MHQRITDKDTGDFIWMMLLKYGYVPTEEEVEDITWIFFAYMEEIGFGVTYKFPE